MCRLPFFLLALLISVAAFHNGHAELSGRTAPARPLASPTPTPNLNGPWMDGARAVTITQSGSSVTATYDADYDCDPRDGGPIQKTHDDFNGATLSGNQLSGQITVCSWGKGNANGTGLKKSAFNLTVSADGQKLEGSFFNSNTGKDVPITITRKCGGKTVSCPEISAAMQTLMAAKQAPGSAAGYQSLQQNLGAQLDKLRADLCDNPDAQKQVDDIRQMLNSLNYVSGQSNTPNNLTLLHIEDGLTSLNTKECSAGPSDVKQCAPGQKKADPGDEEAAKFVKGKFQEALDKVRQTAQQMSDRGASVPQQIKDQIKNLEKAVGYWSQIKAGSCLPPEVVQTMQQVMRDRAAEGHSENCPGMCSALRKWYESLLGTNKSIQGKIFMDDCLARCD